MNAVPSFCDAREMWNQPAGAHKIEEVMADLKIHTDSRVALVDITEQVNRAVAESHVANGLCNLFGPHTTAGVIVSENWDEDVTRDMLMQFERMVPREGGYRHGEGNSQAHILSVMVSTSINIPIRDGKLALGRWQGVMLAEFDGPRERRLAVTVIEEAKGAERR